MSVSGVKTSFWRIALLVVGLGVLVLAALLMAALSHLDQLPVHIMVNGVEMHEVLNLDAFAPGHQLVLVLALAAVLLFALLLLLLLLPVLLLLLVLSLALPVGLVIGIPLLVLAVLATVLLGPLALLVWGLRRLLRSPPPAPTSTTMAT